MKHKKRVHHKSGQYKREFYHIVLKNREGYIGDIQGQDEFYYYLKQCKPPYKKIKIAKSLIDRVDFKKRED